MKSKFSKNKKGLSIIVLVTFSLVIVVLCITISLSIIGALKTTSTNDKANVRLVNINVREQNALQYEIAATIIDFSANYVVEDNVGVIKIHDNSSDVVMFTCMKIYDGEIPNVAEAEWEYTNTFVAPDEGEYFIYGKDAKGNISDAVVVNVEI